MKPSLDRALSRLENSREQQRENTANRYKSEQRQLAGIHVGHDCKTKEDLIQLPSGKTIRTRAINTAAPPRGTTVPIRVAPSGPPISDGRHSGG